MPSRNEFRFLPERRFKNGRLSIGEEKPFLTLRFKRPTSKPGETICIQALVDTGAEVSLIPGRYAAELDHNLNGDNVDTVDVYFAKGNGVCSLHTVTFEILDGRSGKASYHFGSTEEKAKIRFLQDCRHEYAILGVKDFLCDFAFAVNYKTKTFSLERVSQHLQHLHSVADSASCPKT